MTKTEWFRIVPFPLVYDGEETEGGEVENEGGENEGGEETKTKPVEENKTKTTTKTFSQDDLNRILADDRRKNEKSRNDLIKQLQTLKESKNLTDIEKEQLQTRIETLQNETLSTQELAKKDKDKLVRQHQKEIDDAHKKTSHWQSIYTTEKIQRDLTDAAIEHKAFSPNQIMNILSPSSKLVEELKDGQPTGRYVTRVSFVDKSEDGEVKTLELSPSEALKRMKDQQEHWNLFNSGANGGLGQFNSAGGSHSFVGAKPPKDMERYKEWKKSKGLTR